MKKDVINTGKVKINKIVFITSFFIFLIIILQLTRLSVFQTVNGINLKKFASNRNTEKYTLYARRGTIFDSGGEPLAQNIDSYTVIAYLDSKRSKGSSKPLHVVDKQMTAESLSPIINMSVESILKLLNKSNLYQVELGPGGKGITEITKENIESLNLPGIDFIQSDKRYYPNNDFLSYTLGYTQNVNGKIIGEMGIEKYFDDYLKGKDGYLEYQKDLNGYRIPNTPEVRKEQVDGMDIYLTIDDNIQLFVERIIKETYDEYKPEWMLMIAADAKTGKILGTSSVPSFNPNIKNITSYLNPLVSYAYEPGSTMKTFTFMAALEKGTYDGNKTFQSGEKQIGDDVVSDWNGKGWGTISYDQGFLLSANTGAANIMENFLNKTDLKNYLKLLGFGTKTGITLPGEVSGKLNFKYPLEVANAAYGQGITINPIQYIQAMTPLANNGMLLQPYIVDKIVESDTDKIIYQGKRTELREVASETTINKIKDLMYNVVNADPTTCTGSDYKIEGYNIIGKTGTAQYVDPLTGKYLQGGNNYIKSFGGMFPKDDPQIIIYTVVKKPSFGSTQPVIKATTKLIKDIAQYLNMFPSTDGKNNAEIINYEMPNYLNQNINKVIENISLNRNSLVVIGDGTKVINQYPRFNTKINNSDRVFIVTNGSKITMPNMLGWSSRDVMTYCNLTGIACTYNGSGYVINQSIAEGALLDKSVILVADLQERVQ